MQQYKIIEMVTPTNFDNYEKIEIANAPKQYRDIKMKHPDAIILFRVGDFYETYCDDAAICADVLGITLLNSTNHFRMAGFPHHAIDAYLPKLIRSGKRVAICEPIKKVKKKTISQVCNQS